MSIPVSTRDDALNAIVVTHLSLHSDFPGAIGANEIAGSRTAVTYATSSGGQRAQVSSLAIAVPPTTVRWIGAWNGAAFKFTMANGGATPKNFVAMPSTDQIAVTAHGFADGTKVAFFYGTPPGGLTEGVVYFTRDATADTLRVAPTLGGTAINLTGESSFGCVVSGITEAVHTSSGTHTIDATTMAVPT